MTKNEFLEELSFLLNESPDVLADDTELDSLEGWDSTCLLGVIALMDGELGIELDIDAFRECKTIGDMVKMASEKLTK